MKEKIKSPREEFPRAHQGGETCDTAKDTQSSNQSINHLSWKRDSLPNHTKKIKALEKRIFGSMENEKWLQLVEMTEAHFRSLGLPYSWSKEDQLRAEKARFERKIARLVSDVR
jgi:hypothetical protein